MAKHEFGIMDQAPQSGARYDAYEPGRYRCISVEDADLEHIVADFRHIDCCWHSPDVKEKGLAYCGITLIPPSSLAAFADILQDHAALAPLKELALRAMRAGKWIIHFGL